MKPSEQLKLVSSGLLHEKTTSAHAHSAGATVERLAAVVAALELDAKRYRWLRDKAPGEICFDHTQSQDEGSHFLLRVPFDGEPINNDAEGGMKLDAAIDAALAVGAA